MLVTIVDQNFLGEAETCIRSCARYNPEERFYLYLVNADSQLDRKIAKWHSNILIEHCTVPYKKKDWAGIICGLRCIPILKALEEFNQPTIYLDSDVLLRGSVRPVLNDLQRHDLMVKLRPQLEVVGPMGTPHAAKFNAGIIGFGNSQVAIDFAREFHRRLTAWYDSGKPFHMFQDTHQVITGVDQELLYVLYEEWKERIRFKDLGNKYNDSSFDANSVIWHGKGKARNRRVYRLEQLYYKNRLLWLLSKLYLGGLRRAKGLMPGGLPSRK